MPHDISMESERDLVRIEALLASRWSCRGFLPHAVPAATLHRVLAIAQRTASWCNSQPWQLVITQPAATERFRTALYAHAKSSAPAAPDFAFPQEYQGKYLERRRDAGFRLYNAVGIGRADNQAKVQQSLENFRFFGAPHVAVISTDSKLGPYGAVDCGAYVANFLLCAHAAGIATIPQAAIAHHSDFVRQYLEIPDDRLVVCGISFGYADPAHPANAVRTGRASVEEAVSFME
jgi:nitroreductase